eukprot:1127214-Amphidinium_carterae.1
MFRHLKGEQISDVVGNHGSSMSVCTALCQVGCHVGATTKVIASVAKAVIGLDQKAMLVEQARINYPHI